MEHSANYNWLVIGDFNEVRSQEERISKVTYYHGGPPEFIQVTSDALHLKLPLIVGKFTWPNKQSGDKFIQSR